MTVLYSPQVAEALRDCKSLAVSDDDTMVKRLTVSSNGPAELQHRISSL